MKKFLVFSGLLALFAICCNTNLKLTLPKDVSYVPAAGEVPQRESLEQGWSDEVRSKFWFTGQGAHVMPYTWFTWLEQADNKELFRSTKNMERLGYLPADSSRFNPSGLPIGFAISKAKSFKDAYVGFTCAACHTNQLDYKDKKYLIDGAPTLANFVGFFSEMIDAMDATHQDAAKFDRFARRVLGQDYNASKADQLKSDLLELAISSGQRREVNALPPAYPADFTSYGRLDAFTNIENAGTAFALNDLTNKNIPNAPVSYPFLWGTHQSDVVQWAANAPNTPVVGPLVRNAGEVVGVFGGLRIEKAGFFSRLFGKKIKYTSTIDFHGLGALEGYVKILKAPNWEDTNFPEIDAALATRGSVLFAQHCQSCHEIIPHDDPYRHYKANQSPVDSIGTDHLTAWNIEHHKARTDILAGRKTDVIVGKRFKEVDAAIAVPVDGVIGYSLEHLPTLLEAAIITGEVKENTSIKDHMEIHTAARDAIVEQRAAQHQQQAFSDDNKKQKNKKGLVYKGRPLNGIWATAPYLHNGSVPTLWALLQKEEDRPDMFWVGSRAFDPVHVGYQTDAGKSQFRVRNEQGDIQEGNSNRGHTAGTQLSDEEKWAIVEFMKTL